MGIGAATVRALLDEGARVFLVDLVEPATAADGYLPVDVSVPEQCAHAVDSAAKALGGLDVLVNAAGIQVYGDVESTDLGDWGRALAVNLSGAFYMARFALPHLRNGETPAIVNVASVQAFAAQRGVAAYSASKGGLVALTRAMAVDCAPTVRVNAVCPGSVDTPMLRASARRFAPEDPDEAVRQWGQLHPLGRPAWPEEVAQAICYLASAAASFVTGAALRVDGGLLSRIGGT